jgi:quercetin dioxygenase-like cupin family protein
MKEQVVTSTAYVGRIEDLPLVDCSDFILGAQKRIVFGPDHFWQSHVMRYFKLDPYSAVIPHRHPWEHHALCVGGSGRFLIGDDEYAIEPGSWIYVPVGYKHAFWNPDEAMPLEIICIVPAEGDVNPLVIPHQPEFC